MRKKRIKTKQDAIDLVQEQHRLHKEKWLTWEVAEKYHRRACALKMPTNEIKGETRELMLELMREYGVTQLEAVNILQGYHIAESGNTGRSTGPHCHFEIRVGGVPNDPLKFLP